MGWNLALLCHPELLTMRRISTRLNIMRTVAEPVRRYGNGQIAAEDSGGYPVDIQEVNKWLELAVAATYSQAM